MATLKRQTCFVAEKRSFYIKWEGIEMKLPKSLLV